VNSDGGGFLAGEQVIGSIGLDGKSRLWPEDFYRIAFMNAADPLATGSFAVKQRIEIDSSFLAAVILKLTV
jgi:hypothetical protein